MRALAPARACFSNEASRRAKPSTNASISSSGKARLDVAVLLGAVRRKIVRPENDFQAAASPH